MTAGAVGRTATEGQVEEKEEKAEEEFGAGSFRTAEGGRGEELQKQTREEKREKENFKKQRAHKKRNIKLATRT